MPPDPAYQRLLDDFLAGQDPTPRPFRFTPWERLLGLFGRGPAGA
jgi:hypothetical protein